jgi:hypothetical protein
MEFTFHHSYVILELVPSTVIFWIELSYWRKSYSIKATLLLCWSHRYKYSTVVITIGLTIVKYPYLKWQWIFYLLCRCFLSSITMKTFTGIQFFFLSYYVSLRSEFRVAHLCLSFFSCSIMCLYVLSSVLWYPLRFPHKIDVQFVFTSSCL